jgi:general secretion pathway protein H
VTLVEILIALAIVAVVGVGAAWGSGTLPSARLKRGAVLLSTAIRAGYAHSTQRGKPARLTFNFVQRDFTFEEADRPMLVAPKDVAGGAEPATAAEKEAVAEADAILKGPRAPRASFRPVIPLAFDLAGNDHLDNVSATKHLEPGIHILLVDTGHQQQASHNVDAERAYLYFFPGGMTERAVIQLGIGPNPLDDDVMTLFVHPLTGQTELHKGRRTLPKPRTDQDASERVEEG